MESHVLILVIVHVSSTYTRTVNNGMSCMLSFYYINWRHAYISQHYNINHRPPLITIQKHNNEKIQLHCSPSFYSVHEFLLVLSVVQHTWHPPIVHGPRVGRADVEEDKDDDVALHVNTGTRLTRFGKFEDENGHFCSSGTKLSFRW
jgi:hypothetical protein